MISLWVFHLLLILFLNSFHDIGFNRVIYLNIIVAINHESTFATVSNFLNIILEVLEAGKLPIVNHDTVTDNTNLGITGNFTVDNHKSTNSTNPDEVEGYLSTSEFDSERVEDLTTKLNAGDTVEAVILTIDRKNRSIKLSVKAKDAKENREALNNVNTTSKIGRASCRERV